MEESMWLKLYKTVIVGLCNSLYYGKNDNIIFVTCAQYLFYYIEPSGKM